MFCVALYALRALRALCVLLVCCVRCCLLLWVGVRCLHDFLVYLEEVVLHSVHDDRREDVLWCAFGVYLAQVVEFDSFFP